MSESDKQITKQVSWLYNYFKEYFHSEDPFALCRSENFLFQVSRSCDKKLLLGFMTEDQKTQVPEVRLFGMKSNTDCLETLNPEAERAFGFSPAVFHEPGVHTTTSPLFSGRQLFLLRESGKARAMVYFGSRKVKLIGVHVKMDIMKIGPPSIHGIYAVGYDLQTKTLVVESLSVQKFMLENAKILTLF